MDSEGDEWESLQDMRNSKFRIDGRYREVFVTNTD